MPTYTRKLQQKYISSQLYRLLKDKTKLQIIAVEEST